MSFAEDLPVDRDIEMPAGAELCRVLLGVEDLERGAELAHAFTTRAVSATLAFGAPQLLSYVARHGFDLVVVDETLLGQGGGVETRLAELRSVPVVLLGGEGAAATSRGRFVAEIDARSAPASIVARALALVATGPCSPRVDEGGGWRREEPEPWPYGR